MKGRSGFLTLCLFGGLIFLYGPILTMIVYSFNVSKLATVWGGFSTKWYGELLDNTQVIDAALLSLRIAAVSATVATAFGTLAGITLARFGRFRGCTLFSGMITAPLVMPDVITGLSLLLLFVAMEQAIGWPDGRGSLTIIIAHITFSMAYVAVIIQSRLAAMDNSLEEAALDLGSRPLQVMVDITLPLLAPGMVAGWLLAFTLSLDDLVIATFTTGPGANTLPMVVFSKVKLGVKPDINALATIVILTVGLVVAAASIIGGRVQRQRLADTQRAAAEPASAGPRTARLVRRRRE
ncbi:ABC transporter permease subunit [Labrys wisconsinensis]|uniref:Putrescine transport system permease protein n=1 Tax=Labrys wisconsinensis TaxID=425677 RepID=A0ABU0JQ00_9HYPH|nr:ABC transporter permease subunit [Labrys wisconsinensis]MDQ0475349.1 putrescine transport system permease protein [Labrys wisconsinensis]